MSEKGADARRQAGKETLYLLGAAPDAGTVLRASLKAASKESAMNTIRTGLLAVVFALSGFTQASSTQLHREARVSDREKLIGAWQLVSLRAPGSNGKTISVSHPAGMLTYTRDGHVSVQLMYPASQSAISNEYVLNGYEASFGSYDVNDSAHTVTHHIQGSNTRDLLVGKDLLRVYQFSPDGNLVIRSARPDEHWSVTWKHY